MRIIKRQDVTWGKVYLDTDSRQKVNGKYHRCSCYLDYKPNMSEEIRVEDPFIFHATLEIASINRGRSAANFSVKDNESNTFFTVHMSELFKLMPTTNVEQGTITGYWQFVKKGSNIGLTFLPDFEE